LRDDGRPQAGGALPALIQWDGEHPTAHMAASGLALQALAIGPLPAEALALVRMPSLQPQADAGLQVTLRTPRGRVLLSTGAGTITRGTADTHAPRKAP
jgi:hypothetical protein